MSRYSDCAHDLADLVRATGKGNGQSWEIPLNAVSDVLARHFPESGRFEPEVITEEDIDDAS